MFRSMLSFILALESKKSSKKYDVRLMKMTELIIILKFISVQSFLSFKK